ncbi:cell wall biosynthesis protein [Methanobrevibacter millerae]|uniref:Cell wall biosynthesis protein n=2 Tax=Methanobrevibacter millerae TaxID=230361 RepID=A0A0U3E291_9EURY|nr:cell wall biosynthesis protein [Methanobrevibacter millerae]ALT68135.1 cell wall biosynthesis protein [Methanobrevibacter millerae]
MYVSMVYAFIYVFIVTALGTLFVDALFRFLGKRGFLGNLFPNVRGGIPRGVGIIPFIVLSFYLLPGYNDLVLIIGICAFIDDVFGRRKFSFMNIEIGQFSRGIGMILVMILGFIHGFGLSSIIIAFLIQPLNISDMQPGSCAMVTMVMSIVTIICMVIAGSHPVAELPATYTPLLIFVVCLAYCPLDFAGKIMLGEVGNHTFAVALGIAFYLTGGFWWTLLLAIFTVLFTAFVRRSTLKVFFRQRLRLLNPTFGDYIMDVLTGGGLGDLFRKWILKDKQYEVNNEILISLGFRRLLFNPHAVHTDGFVQKEPQSIGRVR